MDLSKVAPGNKAPDDVNVVIEIAKNGDPVKYELDKDTNMLMVDRFMNVAMRYPQNYGFVPNTLGMDGDPIDVLVITDYPLMPGCLINCVPVGVFEMEDESGMDEKIICVPSDKLNPSTKVKSLKDLPKTTLAEIEHFFEHYKDLEKNKWVKSSGYKGATRAKKLIKEAVKRYGK